MARDLMRYIRTDKNGTKIYEDWECPRCGGEGFLDMWKRTGRYCYACGGSGHRNRPKLVKEYTPEYWAKLEAKRIAKQKKYEEEHAEEIAAAKAEQERLEAERKAEEEAWKVREAELERIRRGHYYGEVGQKIEIEVTYCGCFFIETIYGGSTVYKFDTDDGAHLIWMTSGSLGGDDVIVDDGSRITIRASIKAHKEFRGVEQTQLTRVKVIKGGRPFEED